MTDLPFNHPEARRKRAAAIDAEISATMAQWAAKHQPEPQVRLVEERRGTIYFIGPEEGPIKIGFARHPDILATIAHLSPERVAGEG